MVYLHEMRIPMTEEEAHALDLLTQRMAAQPTGLTRRDPGNTGPVLAHYQDQVFEIDEITREVRKVG